MTVRVATFGEIMMRLASPGPLRFGQTQSLELTYGGGEANVAAALAQWGLDVRYLTRLPDNPFGRACRDRLRSVGIDTSFVAWGGKRLGIYFLETGFAQRPSVVVYDRADSAFATVSLGEIDFAAVLDGVSHFHFTGISPAVSDAAAAVTAQAVEAAKKAGAAVSCDLNYRGKLWSRDKARAVMTPLMRHVDLLIANESDAADVFGIQAEGTDITRGKVSIEGYRHVAQKLASAFGFKQVAITLRESLSATHNRWSALLLDAAGGADKFHHSRTYDILPIVDRVGGGDSFAAGLIYGLATGQSPGEALEFAVAASCLKHSIAGDWALITLDEVKRLLAGDASGRVKR